jgi:curved DNA-binding protein CbpA
MQIAKDFYSVLDIPPGTSKEEIRQAYLRLARRYHPDVNDDPRSRERFEEINQAYTILSDDEARIFYNLYREGAEEDDLEVWSSSDYYPEAAPLAWWQRNTSTLGVGLAVTCVLAAYGLVIYMPSFQNEAYTRAPVTESVVPHSTSTKSDQTSKTRFEPSSLEKTPQAAIQETSNAATAPTPQVKPNALEPISPAVVTDPLGIPPMLSTQTAVPLALETPARAYEMLAYYALVVGDLNQFKSALDLAHRKDSSLKPINSLILSHQQMRSRKMSLGNTLQALRRQVIRENAARLTPPQLEALSQSVQSNKF